MQDIHTALAKTDTLILVDALMIAVAVLLDKEWMQSLAKTKSL
jgi:hypothetical protein